MDTRSSITRDCLAGAQPTGLLHLVLAGLAISSQAGCFCSKRAIDAEASAAVGAVKAELRPIHTAAPGEASRCQRSYLDYYGIEAEPASCQFGTFESGGVTIAAQFYCPARSSKGTVIFVHGYLDHSACGHHLINRLVAEGYNVATYDHPGHGLSGGRRVSTDDFAIYEETLSDFVNIAQSELPAPYDVVAHSMGGTVVIDHLQAHPSTPLRRIILIAPMIKDGSPKHLKRFCHAISPLVDYLPRFPENSSSDPELAACIKSDPLQSRYVSTHWSRSFSRWRRQDRIRQATPSDRSPLVISAGIETVIDEPASNRWMRNAFPNGRFVTIDGAHHQLLNEAEAKRAQVLNMICDELSR